MGDKTKQIRRRVTWLAMLVGSAAFLGSAALASERVLRTPTKKWVRELSGDLSRVTLINTVRVAAVDLRIGDELPDDRDVQRLVERLSGQTTYRVRGKWSAEILKQANVQMGVSITLPDGRKGMYAAMWRKRPDGRYSVAGYMAISNAYSEENVADFKLVRSLGNQMARGAILAPSLIPLAGPTPIIIATLPPPVPATPVLLPPQSVATPAAVSSGAVVAVAVPVAVPAAVVPVAAVTAPVASAAQTVSSAAVPVAAAVPALSIAARSYPFVAVAGAGVPVTQIASLLYAPLESSEVFVLFKDGSFHEDMPVALEEWNAGASRNADPSSWGQWKTSTEPGEFELSYAADDVVTIAATKIKPAKSGTVLDGSYVVEGQNGMAVGEQIAFSGNRFSLRRQGQETGGIYRVENYSVILNYDDGRSEHRPFFLVPPEEDDDDPSIWLGDTLRVRID